MRTILEPPARKPQNARRTIERGADLRGPRRRGPGDPADEPLPPRVHRQVGVRRPHAEPQLGRRPCRNL